MGAELYVRHSSKCRFRDNKYSRRCKRRKRIALAGIDKKIAAGTRSWAAAEIEAKGLAGSDGPAGQKVRADVTAFLAGKAQALSKGSNTKLKRELTSLADFGDTRKLASLDDLNLQALEDYRTAARFKRPYRNCPD